MIPMCTMTVSLWDYDDDGLAVWQCIIDGDPRYVEGRTDDTVLSVYNRALSAYEDEEA